MLFGKILTREDKAFLIRNREIFKDEFDNILNFLNDRIYSSGKQSFVQTEQLDKIFFTILEVEKLIDGLEGEEKELLEEVSLPLVAELLKQIEELPIEENFHNLIIDDLYDSRETLSNKDTFMDLIALHKNENSAQKAA